MNIGSITWPEENKEAVSVYLKFLIGVLEELDITFPDIVKNPMGLAARYLEGVVSDAERLEVVSHLWNYLGDKGATQDFNEKDILMVRLALCLLIVPDDVEQLGDYLSWFFEVLGFLYIDLDVPIKMMDDYFSFEK